VSVPVVILGGYLGAGKTTLLNALLRSPQSAGSVVLLNDFGSVNVDSRNVAGSNAGAIELTNGCACCTIGSDLATALGDAVRRAPKPRRILLETSGVADPARIALIASAVPGVSVAAVVVVADAQTVLERSRDRYVGELVRRQLRSAGAIVLTKVDLTGGSAPGALREWIGSEIPGVAVLESANDPGSIVPALFELDARPRLDAGSGPAPDGRGFASVTFRSTVPVRRDRFVEALAAIPSDVLRAKGTVLFDDEPERLYSLQRTDASLSIVPCANRRSPPETQIVAIAPADREEALSRLLEALHQALAPAVEVP